MKLWCTETSFPICLPYDFLFLFFLIHCMLIKVLVTFTSGWVVEVYAVLRKPIKQIPD